MEDIFDAAVGRTRSRLDVPQVITLFGAKVRPRTARGRRPPRLEVAIETPAYDLTKFKVHFGNLTLKGYTKGERVLRFEGIAHNTKDLRCGRTLDKFAPIVTASGRWSGSSARHWTASMSASSPTACSMPCPPPPSSAAPASAASM